MNIFYLDRNPKTAAQYHCDKHSVKMVLETTMMLSTALHVYGCLDAPMKVSFKNHPSTVWTRTSQANYLWMCYLLEHLCAEYTDRYGKEHFCQRYVTLFLDNAHYIPLGPFTDPPQCMPPECKRPDAVEGYRAYYIQEKAYFAKWKTGRVPSWWPTNVSEPEVVTV